MLDTVQIFSVGAAAVIDTVLLIALLEPLLRFAIPFVIWTAVVNVFAAVTFWRVHPGTEDVQARRFLAQLAGILVGMTMLKAFVFFFALFAWPAAAPYLVLACLLS